MELAFMGFLFHILGLDITTFGSRFKSPYHLGLLNCQCDLVAHSSPTMDPFAHGENTPLMFSTVYYLYSDISKTHEIFYIVIKVLHQIGKKINDFIHDMAATHETNFVESFDVIWERV